MSGCYCTECDYYRRVNAIDPSLPDAQWSKLAEAAWRAYLKAEDTECALPQPMPDEGIKSGEIESRRIMQFKRPVTAMVVHQDLLYIATDDGWLYSWDGTCMRVEAPNSATKAGISLPKSASQSWDDLIAENMKALKAIEDAKKANAQAPFAPSGGPYFYFGAPDISQQDTKEMPALEIVELCSAKPPCGLPDEECGQCRAKNCPGVKCWRGCEVKR